jgi:hypothetical protein
VRRPCAQRGPQSSAAVTGQATSGYERGWAVVQQSLCGEGRCCAGAGFDLGRRPRADTPHPGLWRRCIVCPSSTPPSVVLPEVAVFQRSASYTPRAACPAPGPAGLPLSPRHLGSSGLGRVNGVTGACSGVSASRVCHRGQPGAVFGPGRVTGNPSMTPARARPLGWRCASVAVGNAGTR